MPFLFVLGSASELAEEELASVLPGRELTADTFKLLGGTVKVAEIFDAPLVEELAKDRNTGERIVFGLSGNGDMALARKIKQLLEDKGFKARFVLPHKGDMELSSVVVVKQKVEEVYIIDNLMAKTVWVQDFEGWNRRDYNRPAVDPHIGMLPPKIARMMINIGIPATRNQQPETILDPFCGVGTILAEALMVGANVIGADINPRQVGRARKNLEWLQRNFQFSIFNFQLFRADARKISEVLSPNSIDAIVTEPFLGPADQGVLERLYLDSLEDWRKVLRPGGRVVIALPFTIDTTKIMGYSLVAGPYPYFRPQAKVKRNIYIFELATSS